MTEKLRLENDLFLREITVDEKGLHTSSIYHKVTRREYSQRPGTGEFQFQVNGDLIRSCYKPDVHILDGNPAKAGQVLQPVRHEFAAGPGGSRILKISLYSPGHDFMVRACYQIYPDLAGTAKWLEIDCLGKDIHIGKMFFEQLGICPGEFADSDFFARQGMSAQAPMFTSGDDDVIQLHNAVLDEGLYLGNGACGPLRCFMVYPNWESGISCGYNMNAADFNKFMKKGETFVSDKAYLLLYQGERRSAAAANAFREMIRRDLPPCPDHGAIMYCTWLPFLKNINETLLLQLIDRASALGFNYFVIDDGWFTDNGWEVDPEKFPGGLEPVADKVHASGMKLGLWLNIGNDYGQPGDRPEDNAVDATGNVKPSGFSSRGLKTRCLASKHRDIMAQKLAELAGRYRVDYFKLDFSHILSPYGIMAYGCHSRRHAYHRGYADSVFEQYRSMAAMRETVKASYPGLIMDFSFEAFGTERPSIAALRCSELHHASNMNTLHPALMRAGHIRRTLYEYMNLLPNERVLGSLICLQDQNDLENLLTSLVGTPLLAGDLAGISPETAALLKNITKHWKLSVKNAPLTEYQLLRYPAPGARGEWDGFARCAECGRGVVCVFRNDYPGDTVNVRLPGFPDGRFALTDMVSDKPLGACSGEELRSGLEIAWTETNCRAIAIADIPESTG